MLLAVPVILSLGLSLLYGLKILDLFLKSAIIGFLLEYVSGYSYHKTLNRQLWKYDRFAVGGGYTSWLTLPMWGVAGIIFWLLSKSVGL
jgi:uncharacterized membrane protein